MPAPPGSGPGLPSRPGPTRSAVRFHSGLMCRWLELFQQGWPIVMVPLEPIRPTEQRICVQAPRPPWYTNSMSPGLRHLLIAVPDAVYPVAVQVSVTGAAPLARLARLPLT